MIPGINLIGLGEQLVHPRVVDIIKFTTLDMQKTLVLSTNGMVPLKGRLLDALMTCWHVQFSIDTIDEEKLHRIRTGARLSVIEENLQRLLEAKQQKIRERPSKYRRAHPYVNINCVITDETVGGIVDVIKFAEAQREGIDYVQFGSVTMDDYQKAFSRLAYKRNLHQRAVDEALAYARKSRLNIVGLGSLLTLGDDWQNCTGPRWGIGIRPNGDVYGCCDLPDLKLGNVFEQDIIRAWNTRQARELRRRVYSTNPPTACHFCNFAKKSLRAAIHRVTLDLKPLECWNDPAASCVDCNHI